MTYKGTVRYVFGNEKYTHEHGGFETVEDATNWIANRFTYFMLNCKDIADEGIDIHGEVQDEGNGDYPGFLDYYVLHCC